MKIETIKTDKITKGHTIYEVLDQFLREFNDRSVLAVTSKIISVCEGNVVEIGEIDKQKLIQKEADFMIKSKNKYDIPLTIKNDILIPLAGIDESNGDGKYILWPRDPQSSANQIRQHLIERFGIKHAGVIITDSKTSPLRWGTTGVAIAHSGFKALNDYRGKLDLFDRPLEVSQANIADGLAASAVVAMGEGNEQTPMAIIEDLPFVKFQDRNPSDNELQSLIISKEDDLYNSIYK
ncbi:MAG: coenzyme F420-0:L-glutamate ligase [Patescibacteria group bacterium]